LFGRLVPSNIANWTRLGVEGNGPKLDWAPSADISETDNTFQRSKLRSRSRNKSRCS